MKTINKIRWALFLSFNIEIIISVLSKNDLIFLSIGIISLVLLAILVFGIKDNKQKLEKVE